MPGNVTAKPHRKDEAMLEGIYVSSYRCRAKGSRVWPLVKARFAGRPPPTNFLLFTRNAKRFVVVYGFVRSYRLECRNSRFR